MGPVRSLPRHSNGSSLAAVSSQDSLLGASALEQRLRSLFDRVAPFTVGAEEELLLIDAETFQPTPAAWTWSAIDAATRGPIVIGGTKCPSITSKWMTRAPAAITSSI